MADQWYYVSGGRRMGPMSAEELRQVVAAGQLYGTDVVWREGMGEWVQLSTVPELLPPGGIPLGYGVANYGMPTEMQDAYAGFWLRFVAYIIDYIITYVASMAVGFVLGFAIGGMIGQAGGNQQAAQAAAAIIGGISGMVIGWLYYALMESSSRQGTLGKMALGLKVTDIDGRRLTFARATGRFFGKIVSGIILCVGFMMAGFTERKQGLHDIMAGTLVLKKGA